MLERLAPKAHAEGEPAAVATRPHDMTRMLVAEALGAGVLSFLVIASGILAERYAGGNIGLAILIVALSAAAGFAALTRAFGVIARGMFNPAFAFCLALSGKTPLLPALVAAAVQMAAACAGATLAHVVTNTGVVQIATQIQAGWPVWTGEFFATTFVMLMLLRLEAAVPRALPYLGALALLAVALATPSLSLANPAITLARGLTDSFTSIRLGDAGFIVACQFAGALAASLLNAWLFAREKRS